MRTDAPSRWFRLYAEFATDQKVQMLSEVDQRRYLMILCLRCSNGDVTLHDDEVAFLLRVSEADWLSTKAVLVSKNLIGQDNKPTAWERRQYASDSSAERVARHRQKKKQACNDDVTLQKLTAEAETETELTVTDVTVGASASDAQETDPDTPPKKFNALPWLTDRGVDRKVAEDWLKVRKAKRAANTETAFLDVEAEAKAYGWSLADAVAYSAKRSWQGFKGSWVDRDNNASAAGSPPVRKAPPPENFAGRDYGAGGRL